MNNEEKISVNKTEEAKIRPGRATYPLVETFLSIEGEGIRTGAPVVFVRFAGCNLRCSYCDTPYSHTKEDAELQLTQEELTEKILSYNCKRITFTGGEPLLQADYIKWFIEMFPHYEVNIETNGSMDATQFTEYDNCIITMDYKCESSGQDNKMHTRQLPRLRKQDVLKFVVGTEVDLEQVRHILSIYSVKSYVYVSPVFGQMELQRLAKFVCDNRHFINLRMGLQIHKFVWDPEKRGV